MTDPPESSLVHRKRGGGGEVGEVLGLNINLTI